MKLITEASLISQNKNIFNRILTCLKSNKEVSNDYFNKSVLLEFNEDICNIEVTSELKLQLGNVFVTETPDKVYFLSECKYETGHISVYLSQAEYEAEPDVITLSLIKRALSNNRIVSYDTLKKIVQKMDEEGINANNDPYSTELDKLIVHSHLFSQITDTLELVRASNYNTTLNPKFQVKLKLRDSVVPLMWLVKKDMLFNFPLSRKSYKSSVNSSGYRSEESLRYVSENSEALKKMCIDSLRYTPYASLLNPSEESLKKIPHIDLQKTIRYL